MSDQNETCIECGGRSDSMYHEDTGPLCGRCESEMSQKCACQRPHDEPGKIEQLELRVAELIKEKDEYDARRRDAMAKIEEWREKYHELKLDSALVQQGSVLKFKDIPFVGVVDRIDFLKNGTVEIKCVTDGKTMVNVEIDKTESAVVDQLSPEKLRELKTALESCEDDDEEGAR